MKSNSRNLWGGGVLLENFLIVQFLPQNRKAVQSTSRDCTIWWSR